MEFSDVYETLEFLGRGSFGDVKKCVHRQTQQVCAVKEVRFQREDSEEKRKTESEIQLFGMLQHKNIVRLEDVFRTSGCIYVVMEYLAGGDLFDGVVSRSHYSEKDACLCIRQVLEALEYCHSKRIVHRDMKPENILLARKPDNNSVPLLKLADFGIAKSLGENGTIVCEPSGSPIYLAPETILEEPIGCPVDIWGCGVILYALLSGYPPFWNDKVEYLLLSIIQGNYTFPSPYWDNVSDHAKDLIKHMLTVDCTARITASKALQHDWLVCADVSTANRPTVRRRLTAFNGRRKLRAVVLGLIARKRLTGIGYRPSRDQMTSPRRESYIPDVELENVVRVLSISEEEEQEQEEALEEEEEEDIEEDVNYTREHFTDPHLVNGKKSPTLEVDRKHTTDDVVKIKVRLIKKR